MKLKNTFLSLRLLPFLAMLTPSIWANDSQTYAISFSPLHLFAPIVEVALEKQIDRGVSVSGILGFGSISVEESNGSVSERFNVFEAGGQFRYYFVNDFHRGWHIGIEGMYIKPFFDDESNVTVSVNGFAIGPLVGYKWQFISKMICEIQLGYQKLFAQAKAKDNQGNEIDASVEDATALLNINLGLAF